MSKQKSAEHKVGDLVLRDDSWVDDPNIKRFVLGVIKKVYETDNDSMRYLVEWCIGTPYPIYGFEANEAKHLLERYKTGLIVGSY